MKLKKCSVCKDLFNPVRPLQKVCSPSCALELSKKVVAKNRQKEVAQEKRKTKAKLDAMQGLPEYKKKAQAAFNAYIRARDVGKQCISCSTMLDDTPNTFDAGHYRSVGSAPHMRFVEGNVHGQCKHCNNWLAGNHVAYRMGLIERIGVEAVEAIERDTELRKYTKQDLIELAAAYKAKAKALQ